MNINLKNALTPVGVDAFVKPCMEVILTPDKVVITITADGTETIVFSGDKELSKRGTVLLNAGEAKGTTKGDIYDDLSEDFDSLASEIEGISLGIFGIAGELHLLRDEYGVSEKQPVFTLFRNRDDIWGD